MRYNINKLRAFFNQIYSNYLNYNPLQWQKKAFFHTNIHRYTQRQVLKYIITHYLQHPYSKTKGQHSRGLEWWFDGGVEECGEGGGRRGHGASAVRHPQHAL